MKKSCGTWLAVYVVLAVAVGVIVYRRLPEPQIAATSGFFGGIVLWLGFGYLWGIKKKIADAKIIRRGLAGDPPLDGEKIAAIGRIEPSGSALVSPLSRTPCVAYKYEIRDRYTSRHSSEARTFYDGFALTPSMIQTPSGSTRLLGWADLNFNRATIPEEIARKNADEYIAATQFSEPTIMQIRASIQKMMDIYKDDDGTVRFDQKHFQPPETLDNAMFYEWVLRPGEQVCVTGTYSVERGGIVPSKQPIIDPITLEVGPPDAFTRRAAAGAAGYLIGGSIFLAVGLIALVAFLVFVPLDATEQMAPTFRPSWQEVQAEQWIEKRLRVPMRNAGMLNPDESVSVHLEAGQASGRVRSGGVEQSVSRAVAYRTGDERTIDIDNGTVTLSTNGGGVPTRLAIMRHEVPLSDASIQITGVIGRIMYYAEDRACRVTFYAAGDIR